MGCWLLTCWLVSGWLLVVWRLLWIGLPACLTSGYVACLVRSLLRVWLLVVLEFLWVCGALVVHVWSLWFAVEFVVCLLIVLLCGILLCLLCVCYFR